MDESTRAADKRRAILQAARTVFLRHGYGGASMDEVAAVAAVSKQTIYKHFLDKRGLFEAMITADIRDTEALTRDLLGSLRTTRDLAGDLRQFARRHLREITQPHLVRLRRLIIAEAERFPELTRTWYANGPERAHAVLGDLFRALEERGLLRVPDPVLAAQNFNWLVLSIPLNRAMFDPTHTFDQADLDGYADEAVRLFLAAYGVDSGS